MTTSIRRLTIAPLLAVITIFGSLTASASCSERQVCRDDDNVCKSQNYSSYVDHALGLCDHMFRAIAHSASTDALGYSSEKRSQGEAEHEAISYCRQYGGGDDCTIKVSFTSACGALATGPGGIYGSAWAVSRGKAEGMALENCAHQGPGACRVRHSYVRWVNRRLPRFDRI
jgi:Domain of unknown function (DUF4189)